MSASDFDDWFAAYLKQSPKQVELLLRDKAAVRFLIAWSLMETSCFRGFARGKDLENNCLRISEDEGFNSSSLMPILEHFHDRYQDEELYKQLMQRDKRPDIKTLLSRPIKTLSETERLYFLISVVYRYRNNIFHGSKGVESWLKYKPQIEHCTRVMQELITHAAQVDGESAQIVAVQNS